MKKTTRKKIGIITFYHHNYNYGGVLQAYALQKYLENQGFDAKQISFDPFGHIKQAPKSYSLINRIKGNLKKYGLFTTINIYLTTTKEKILNCFCKNKINEANEIIKTRKIIIDKFKKQIPHTSKIYNEQTIHECEKFSSYISGSDQIWLKQNGKLSDAYLLNFVEQNKTKNCYAAGPDFSHYEESEKEYIIKSIKNYNNISVREKNTALYINQMFKAYENNQMAYEVLDPVFLLNDKEWDVICKKQENIKHPYVFIYLLGDDNKIHKEVNKFCKNNNLKSMIVSYPLHKYNNINYDMFDYVFTDGPAEFISAIKNAEFVITDSYHATALSIILKINFCVLNRANHQVGDQFTSERIDNLLTNLHLNTRKTKPKPHNIKEAYTDKIDYIKTNKSLQKSLTISIAFLDKII